MHNSPLYIRCRLDDLVQILVLTFFDNRIKDNKAINYNLYVEFIVLYCIL